MIPELGQFALILALCLALIQSIFPLIGVAKQQFAWMALAKPAACGQFFFLLISYACLTYAFVTNDFSVSYVAENSNTHLPLFYRIAAVWGAHEGSLLLWVTVLGIWTLAVCYFSSSLPAAMLARVLAVLGMVSSGFLLFLLSTSNPFARLLPNFPMDGQDLNPLLQDPGMAIHPPMLYMGYVGFSVAFAFAIAALLEGRLDAAWARWSRPWTQVAWIFLTFGIVLGSGWAYRVLGWGGWWFWDPVENASFLPWLMGTALIHSLAVVEKRGAFKSWTALLAICAFSLSLVGTFLVRSGILTSVHAFANDPARGAFMLQFLMLVVGGSLTLYAWRAPAIRGEGYFQLLSRETLLLLNNVLLVVMMATILLGTLYPLILDATGLGKISVGPPYFNTVFIPFMTLLLLLMGIGPFCRWQQMSGKELLSRLRFTLLLALTLGLLLPLLIAGYVTFYVVLGMTLATWVILTTLQEIKLRWFNHGGFWLGLRQLPLSQYGMTLAHVGVAICVIGVSLISTYHIERDIRMTIGDHVTVGPYDFHLLKIAALQGPNYSGQVATFRINSKGHAVAELNAEKRLYTVSHIPMIKAAIDPGVWCDLYVALGEELDNATWSVRIYFKPFVRWIWFGGLIMMLGGALAASDRRYRPSKVSRLL